MRIIIVNHSVSVTNNIKHVIFEHLKNYNTEVSRNNYKESNIIYNITSHEFDEAHQIVFLYSLPIPSEIEADVVLYIGTANDRDRACLDHLTTQILPRPVLVVIYPDIREYLLLDDQYISFIDKILNGLNDDSAKAQQDCIDAEEALSAAEQQYKKYGGERQLRRLQADAGDAEISNELWRHRARQVSTQLQAAYASHNKTIFAHAFVEYEAKTYQSRCARINMESTAKELSTHLERYQKVIGAIAYLALSKAILTYINNNRTLGSAEPNWNGEQKELIQAKIQHEKSMCHAITNVGNTDQVLSLLKSAQLQVNDRLQNGDSYLHRALVRNNEAIIQLLLLFGADIHYKNIHGKSPLSVLTEKLRDGESSHYFKSYFCLKLVDHERPVMLLSEVEARNIGHAIENGVRQFGMVVIVEKDDRGDFDVIFSVNKRVHRRIMGSRSPLACALRMHALLYNPSLKGHSLDYINHKNKLINAFTVYLNDIGTADLTALGNDIVNYHFIGADISHCVLSFKSIMKIPSLVDVLINYDARNSLSLTADEKTMLKDKILSDYQQYFLKMNFPELVYALYSFMKTSNYSTFILTEIDYDNRYTKCITYQGQKLLLELASADSFVFPTTLQDILVYIFRVNYLSKEQIENPIHFLNRLVLISEIHKLLSDHLVESTDLSSLYNYSRDFILDAIYKFPANQQVALLNQCLNSKTTLGGLFAITVSHFMKSIRYTREIKEKLRLLQVELNRNEFSMDAPTPKDQTRFFKPAPKKPQANPEAFINDYGL